MSQPHHRAVLASAALLAATLVAAGPATAASQRTFVATSGVDNPTCSLASPCRTFGAAVAATLAAGEVIVLDSGGYGAVTIAKSVSIVAPPGVYAGVAVFSGDGVTINAGASDKVVLRGLTINAQGTTGSGVSVMAAEMVELDRLAISGFPSYGLSVDVSAALTVSVRDSAFTGSDTNVSARGASALATPRVIVTGSSILGGSTGVLAASDGNIVVSDSTIAGAGTCVDVSGNSARPALVVVERSRLYNCMTYGAYPGNTSGFSFVDLIDSIVEYSGIGLRAGSQSTTRIVRSTFSHNTVGIDTGDGGIVESPVNNVIRGNGTDGAPTATFSPQ